VYTSLEKREGIKRSLLGLRISTNRSLRPLSSKKSFK